MIAAACVSFLLTLLQIAHIGTVSGSSQRSGDSRKFFAGFFREFAFHGSARGCS